MFNRCFAVGPVTIIEIYAIDTKAGKGFEAGFADVCRVGPEFTAPVRFNQVGELCGDENVVSLAGAFEPFADEVFAVLESTLVPSVGKRGCDREWTYLSM